MIEWLNYAHPNITHGVHRGGIVAVVRRHGELYTWALTDRTREDEGVEASEDVARQRAEVAYQHARGLLGSVRP